MPFCHAGLSSAVAACLSDLVAVVRYRASMHNKKPLARGDKTFMKTPSCFEHVSRDKNSTMFISRLGSLSHHESIKAKAEQKLGQPNSSASITQNVDSGLSGHADVAFHGCVKHRGILDG